MGRHFGKVFWAGILGRYFGQVFWEGILGRYFGQVFWESIFGRSCFLAQKLRRQKYSVGGASDVFSACFVSFSCDVIVSGAL